MNIPSYVQNSNENFMPELIQTLQQGFDNGFQIPNFTTAQIIQLEPDAENGTLWFNSDIGDYQFKRSAGVIRTLVSA